VEEWGEGWGVNCVGWGKGEEKGGLERATVLL
jgi:hypothetical protein